MTTLLAPRPPVFNPDEASAPRKWFSKRVIPSCTAANGPLLTRYHVIATRLFGVYLHHLHTSELRLVGTNQILRRSWRHRFSVPYRPAEFAHRLELVRPTWTLVIRFRVRRHWGFFTRAGWLPWREYGREYCD